MTTIEDAETEASTSTSATERLSPTKNGKDKDIIIFKTPQPTSTQDIYYSTSRENGYKPNFVTVLKEEYDTLSLENTIRAKDEGVDEGDGWEGVVITSRRGAEGWVKAVQSILNTSSNLIEPQKGSSKWEWNDVPLFPVGTSSSEYITQANIPNNYKPKLSEDIGKPAKSAGELARIIIDTPPRNQEKGYGYGRYLFICGDKALDELPSLLRENGRIIEQVVVYRTIPREDIATQLEDVVQEKGTQGWLAFFSPSSAGYVLPYLKDTSHTCSHNQAISRVPVSSQIDRIHSGDNQDTRIAWTPALRWKDWKIFAIGETTAKYLREEGIAVNAVASQPSAEGMMQAILKVDSETGTS